MSHCCEPTCTATAEWHIATGTLPDDATHACTAHVGALLLPNVVNTVTALEVANG